MTQEAAVPAAFLAQVRRIAEESAAKAGRAAPLRNASISEGGTFTVKGGKFVVLHPAADGGAVGAYFGPIYNQSDLSYVGTGVLVQDVNSADIFTARSDEVSGKPLCVLWDSKHNAVLYTDFSGEGLGRPYVPFNFYSARFTDTPQLTTSGAFETLWMANTYKTNPSVYVAASAVSDAGVTGEIRVLVNGALLGSVGGVSATAAAYAFGPQSATGTVGDPMTVQIQARVASGAGAVRVVPQVGTGFPG